MLITNFASGELSPNLNGRVDIQQYYQGAARIENFEIIPTGGIKRRTGIKRLAQLDGNSRIIPFIVNKNNVYVLQFVLNPNYDNTDPDSVPSYINVWKEGLYGAYSTIQTLNAIYTSLAEIKEIQYAQNYDTMVFAHRSYRPMMLSVTGQGVFSLTQIEFDFTPDVELDDDFDYVMVVAGDIFPAKEATADGHGRFTYKRLIDGVPTTYTQDFQSGITDFYCIVNGKLYYYENNAWVVYGTDPEIDTLNFTTATKMPGCVSFFNNRLFFASTMEAHQKVWGSAAPDNYGVRYNDFCTYKKYVTVNKVVKDADIHIFTCSIAKADIDTVHHTTILRNVTQDLSAAGTLKKPLSEYFVSSNIVPVGTKPIAVTNDTITINTSDLALVWDPGDPDQGIPAETQKDNIVMSVQLWRSADVVAAEDYEYMVVANNVTTADCSMFFELASDENDAIMFMSSNRFLAIATESSIWSIDPGISALNINAVMQGRYGSDELQGMAVETATVYFAQGCKGIREFYYNGESKAFQTNNIALLADHILRESQAVDFDYMTNPYSRLLIVQANGNVAQMLYDKTNGIMAWSRLIHGGGEVQSIAVTRGHSENDLVFMIVKDSNNYFLELLDLTQMVDGSVWIDSYSRYNPNAENPTAGYDVTKAVLWNVDKNKTCQVNDIPQDFIGPQDTVYIGYKYFSGVQSMPVVNNDPSGRRRIVALQVRFLDSYLPLCGVYDNEPEKFTTVPTEPYSGIGKVNWPGVTDHDVYFVIGTDEPKRVNILSVDAITS